MAGPLSAVWERRVEGVEPSPQKSGGEDGCRGGGVDRDREKTTSDLGTEEDRKDSGSEAWDRKGSSAEHDRRDPQAEWNGGGQEEKAWGVSGGKSGTARGGED